MQGIIKKALCGEHRAFIFTQAETAGAKLVKLICRLAGLIPPVKSQPKRKEVVPFFLGATSFINFVAGA